MKIIECIRQCDVRSKGVNNASVSDGELLRELIYQILHWLQSGWSQSRQSHNTHGPRANVSVKLCRCILGNGEGYPILRRRISSTSGHLCKINPCIQFLKKHISGKMKSWFASVACVILPFFFQPILPTRRRYIHKPFQIASTSYEDNWNGYEYIFILHIIILMNLKE